MDNSNLDTLAHLPSFKALGAILQDSFSLSHVALLDSLLAELDSALHGLDDVDHLNFCRVEILGKKGIITIFLKQMKDLDPALRGELNRLKTAFTALFDAYKITVTLALLQKKLDSDSVDVTLPPRDFLLGRVHPLTQASDEVIAIFSALGFKVAEGGDVEEDWYNFTALNIPETHPARRDHDTFYLRGLDSHGQRLVLRTHTSPVQIRTMMAAAESHAKTGSFNPIRIIVPGRMYRADDDATHSPMFHQVEGLVIDRATHFGHLRHTLMTFLQAFFCQDSLPVRFRPSYFPFTEPSVEVDIGCTKIAHQLRIGAGADWLEILGAGMVHPKVIANCGLDPSLYQGFAFGMGLERLTMLKYGIPDLRPFFMGDSRWLHHYGFMPTLVPSLVEGLL